MASNTTTLSSTSPIIRRPSPTRHSSSPIKRVDSWCNSSNWRSGTTTPADLSPTRKSHNSSPLQYNSWRTDCSPSRTANKKDMSPTRQGDFWHDASSPARPHDSSGSSSPGDQSPTSQTGIGRLMVKGKTPDLADLPKRPENQGKEEVKVKKRTPAKKLPASPSKSDATPVKSNRKATASTATSDTASTSTAIDSTNAAATTSSTDLTTTSTATQTPKHKKKGNNNSVNQGQPSQQKSRKTTRTPAADIATPMKKQEYYAGPAFANSPAPSSLPIPKFFLRQEAAKAASDSPRSASASPAVHDSTTKPRSGLDMLFDADRKEKATKQQPYSTDSNNSQTTATNPHAYSKFENGQVVGLTEEGWRDYQSQQLKDLIAGKPSTPESRSAKLPSLQQHMSAPAQFQSRMPSSSSTAAPPHDYEQQSDNYYYGNRHLSPMFEAAREGTQSDSSAGFMKSVQPKHYRQPTSLEEQAKWDRFSQYSPNPTRTAPYMPSVPAENHGVPIPQHLQAQAAKAQKEDAIRKMIGMN